MLRYSDYVRILVRPNFPVTCEGDSLADCEETKIFDGCERTQVILGAGVILKDFHPLLVYNYVGGLMNFQSEFRSNHVRHLRPFVSRIHPTIHTRVRYLLQLPLAVGIPAESLNAVDNPDFILCLSRRLLIARAPGKTLHSYKIAHAICKKLSLFS